MLPLDDPRWSDLQHAYGSAADIPALLRMLRASPAQPASPEDEPWFSLWSSLCHQGDVYPGSYAAVPHIVQIARETTTPIALSFFQLPAAIEVARLTGRGAEVPAPDALAYTHAIADLPEIVTIHLRHAWDRETLLCAAAALAVGKGHAEIAETLLNLDDDWIARINNCEFD